jgi:hypothetical protein
MILSAVILHCATIEALPGRHKNIVVGVSPLVQPARVRTAEILVNIHPTRKEGIAA